MAGGSALVTWVGAWPGRPEINSTAIAVTAKISKGTRYCIHVARRQNGSPPSPETDHHCFGSIKPTAWKERALRLRR